jgi:hypothetical protein
LKVRFQADADLDEDIVTGLRRREPIVDFQTATEAGLRGLNDRQVLEQVAEEGRVLVSHDRRTMPHHFADFIMHQNSPGLVIISQKTSTLVAIEELLLIWMASESEEWINRIAVIPL